MPKELSDNLSIGDTAETLILAIIIEKPVTTARIQEIIARLIPEKVHKLNREEKIELRMANHKKREMKARWHIKEPETLES